MCGLLGYITNGRLKTDQNSFRAALDLMTHRGPDDSGVYVDAGVMLGHRRLSIIDLSKAGRQPMVDPETGNTIVFNGEIFNYVELREALKEKGHRFRTQTDTEVLLASYRQWGADCLSKLNGMWAFAIYEPWKNRVFIARDRFGIKPFYYHQADDGAICFASEPKSILHLFPEARKVNKQTLYEFLAQGLLYSSQNSFYQRIMLLPPAHYGLYNINHQQLSIHRYWDYPPPSEKDLQDEDAAEMFIQLFNDAVSIRLRSDVPVGITLSGGIDSTAVLAGMHQAIDGGVECYTSVYDNGRQGEYSWADIAADVYGDALHAVEASKEDWLETLLLIAWHMDAPGYSPAVYPLWYIMQRARKDGVIVLLEGQGADEAFGGYPQYGILSLLTSISEAVRSFSTNRIRRCRTMARALTETFTARWVALWLIRETAPFLVDINRRFVGAAATLRQDVFGKMVSSQRETAVGPPYDRVTQRLKADHALNILPGLLHYGDAISMAHSVESRLPFMDYRLVEFVFSSGAAIKINEGVTKWVIREYLNRSGQTRIADRKDKLGYPTPVELWMAEERGAMVRDVLLDRHASIHEYCDPGAIRRLIDKLVAGNPGVGNHLYRLLSTELWLQECLGGG